MTSPARSAAASSRGRRPGRRRAGGAAARAPPRSRPSGRRRRRPTRAPARRGPAAGRSTSPSELEAGLGPRQDVGRKHLRPWRRTERLRRTATRRSCRNSGSTSSIVPWQVDLDASARLARTRRKPSTAGSVRIERDARVDCRSRPGRRRRRPAPSSTTSPSISVDATWGATISPSSLGLLLVAGQLVDRRRTTRRASRASAATRVVDRRRRATTLPSPLRRSARRVPYVTAQPREQGAHLDDRRRGGPGTGPGGRSAANRGAGATTAGARPRHRSPSARARRPGGSRRSPARCSQAVERVEHRPSRRRLAAPTSSRRRSQLGNERRRDRARRLGRSPRSPMSVASG